MLTLTTHNDRYLFQPIQRKQEIKTMSTGTGLRLRGIDTYNEIDFTSVLNKNQDLWVGCYLSNGVATIHTPLTEAAVAHIHAANIKIASLLEHGTPNNPAYFTLQQAKLNLEYADLTTKLCGQPRYPGLVLPPTSIISNPAHITAVTDTMDLDTVLNQQYKDYTMCMHDGLSELGFLHGVYGNGEIIMWAKQSGYAHFGWLSESTGFRGYQECMDDANYGPDIVQSGTTTLTVSPTETVDIDTDYATVEIFGQW